jgi:acyl carrier protein
MADNTEILASLSDILKEATGGDIPQEVTEEKSFEEDLDVDSLTMVEVAVLTEKKLGVKIPDDEIPNLTTVGDAVNYIASNAKQ